MEHIELSLFMNKSVVHREIQLYESFSLATELHKELLLHLLEDSAMQELRLGGDLEICEAGIRNL